MFIFLICSGIGFSWYMLYLPLVILTQYLLTLGILFITCSINVYIRDFEYIVNFVMQMLFYATPILYSTDIFNGSFIGKMIQLNPMTTIVNCYRDILYWHNSPHIMSLLIVLGLSFILCCLGLAIFKKLSRGFAEEV